MEPAEEEKKSILSIGGNCFSVFRAPIPISRRGPLARLPPMGGRRARGGSFPSGERRGLAAYGKDKAPSTDHSF